MRQLENFEVQSFTHSVFPSNVIGLIFACVCEVQLPSVSKDLSFKMPVLQLGFVRVLSGLQILPPNKTFQLFFTFNYFLQLLLNFSENVDLINLTKTQIPNPVVVSCESTL